MLSKIRALKPKLSRSEQRVAEIILAAPEQAVRLPVAALAQQAQVSEPTVIRFCRSVGCEGLQDFKLLLAQDLASQMRYAQQAINSDDNVADVSLKVIDGAIASLVQVRQQIDGAALSKAIDLLDAAHRVEFYGLGGAAVVAMDAQLKFFRLGIPTVAYADAYIHNVAASLLKPRDVAVALSNSGRSRDLLRSVELALETGAEVIAITASRSPLAERASVALTVDLSAEQDHYAPIKARIPHMVIIDSLAIGLALRRGPETLEQLARLPDLLRDKFL